MCGGCVVSLLTDRLVEVGLVPPDAGPALGSYLGDPLAAVDLVELDGLGPAARVDTLLLRYGGQGARVAHVVWDLHAEGTEVLLARGQCVRRREDLPAPPGGGIGRPAPPKMVVLSVALSVLPDRVLMVRAEAPRREAPGHFDRYWPPLEGQLMWAALWDEVWPTVGQVAPAGGAEAGS